MNRPSIRGYGAYVLYLGYDGVLHPDAPWVHRVLGASVREHEGHKLFENVLLLQELLLPYPELLIVLSTHWVARYGLGYTGLNLHPTVRRRVLGATYRPNMDREVFLALPKGQQVLDDLAWRQPKAWIAVDDDIGGWPPECLNQVVFTHPVSGIAEPSARERLAKALAALDAGRFDR